MTATQPTRATLHKHGELKRRRVLAGLDQEEMAKRARISWPYLSLLESGKRSPSVKVLHRLAAALDCPVEDLLA
ncbi:helix-turn-helix domain-containing protein [Herbidospora mongoliensis]|uniref:helix-turn-helix domain-containing protein n=1 Tax=Herbidospora mongoliensis TaxID=688067 RepID=UPI00082FFF87|nr:helix-turn-helix transcriptional regulator [Herbidospora mongoliensis]